MSQITSKAAARLLAFPSHPTRSRRVVSPTAGTRAPAFQALGLALSPWPSEPKVTQLVNAGTQHCPPGSSLLERKKAKGSLGRKCCLSDQRGLGLC